MRAAILAALICCLSGIAQARDLDGRYASDPLKPWFDRLSSKKGLCCSFADGVTVSDVDWRSHDGGYQVRLCPHRVLDGDPACKPEWLDVPDEAVVTEPNKAKRTIVWPYWPGDGHETKIRCFIPGAES